jgi:hypothetical protein
MPIGVAFLNTIRMIKAAITMPIPQVTFEISFSKMKFIKNYGRNSMSDSGLSDLTVLAAERSFEIDFEQVVDVFANNRNNSRIMLRRYDFIFNFRNKGILITDFFFIAFNKNNKAYVALQHVFIQ